MNTFNISMIITVVILIIGMPFAIIWSLNTLFSFGIGYSFQTWLATVILGSTWFGRNVTSNKK